MAMSPYWRCSSGKVIPFNLFWKISPVIVLLALLLGLFIPMGWARRSRPVPGRPRRRQMESRQDDGRCPCRWLRYQSDIAQRGAGNRTVSGDGIHRYVGGHSRRGDCADQCALHRKRSASRSHLQDISGPGLHRPRRNGAAGHLDGPGRDDRGGLSDSITSMGDPYPQATSTGSAQSP